VYAKNFTDAELKALEDFYKTDAGSKIIKAQLALTAPALSAADQQAVTQFATTPLGKSISEWMLKVERELQQTTAAMLAAHQKEYSPKFRELDR
jgi:hypothetical protein